MKLYKSIIRKQILHKNQPCRKSGEIIFFAGSSVVVICQMFDISGSDTANRIMILSCEKRRIDIYKIGAPGTACGAEEGGVLVGPTPERRAHATPERRRRARSAVS